MKIIFSSIKNNDIFETDFAHLSSQNGTIEFKHMQGSGGIAVIYAPNGTGKTSLANLLDVEVSTEKNSFVASDDQGNTITPETMAFHVIQDQLNRNVIRGKTTDYLIGAQIRREYELRDQINAAFRNAYEQLSSKYKAEFKVSKVGDYLLTQIESVQDTTHQTAFQYIRSIVNTRQHGKDIDRNTFVAFIRNDENRPNLSEMDTTKRSFIITDLSKSKVVEKILAIKPDEIIADTSSVLVERHDDAIGILKKYHFGNVFNGSEIISVSDILSINCNNLDILDETLFPLLADTLEQTLVYYHLRMKVEKELVDIFSIHTNDTTMLNQSIKEGLFVRLY